MNRLNTLVVAALCLTATTTMAQTFAITGARVHTMSPAGTLDDATLIVQDGRILDVGASLAVPPGVAVVDARGKVITPGLVSPYGALGIVEVDGVVGTVDGVQRGAQFSAGFDIADAYNPRSTLIAVNRSEGITSALIAPQSAPPDPLGNASSVMSGLAAIVSLQDGKDFLVRRGAAMIVNLGESGGEFAGGSRAAALLILRQAFEEAIDYRENKAAHDRGDWRDYSLSRADLDALQPVLERRIPLLARVNRAIDISVAIDMAIEYRIRLVVVGGSEAWMVADALAAANVPVILDSMNNLPASFDKLNARLDTAKLLHEAGVLFTFGGDSANQTHNARNITQAAGIAVANGLDWDAALRAITAAPAEVLGIADSRGSLAPGAAADLVIWPGDPLELTNYPEAVYISGQAVNMQNRQTMLRDRYLQASDKPPAFRD
ncbi:MAG: amidohydrolase family protein [Woeseiaceae bacterium]